MIEYGELWVSLDDRVLYYYWMEERSVLVISLVPYAANQYNDAFSCINTKSTSNYEEPGYCSWQNTSTLNTCSLFSASQDGVFMTTAYVSIARSREPAGLVGNQRVPASSADILLLGEYCNFYTAVKSKFLIRSRCYLSSMMGQRCNLYGAQAWIIAVRTHASVRWFRVVKASKNHWTLISIPPYPPGFRLKLGSDFQLESVKLEWNVGIKINHF